MADVTNSSNLRRLEYHASVRTMLVRFTNSWEYVYGNVPESLYTAILAAESPGHAFDELVKKANPKLPYERVAK